MKSRRTWEALPSKTRSNSKLAGAEASAAPPPQTSTAVRPRTLTQGAPPLLSFAPPPRTRATTTVAPCWPSDGGVSLDAVAEDMSGVVLVGVGGCGRYE